MSKTSHIRYITPKHKKHIQANPHPKEAKKKQERKLFTIVDKAHQKKLIKEESNRHHEKLLEEMKLERKLKKMKSFKVPKDFKDRALMNKQRHARKTTDDDPTAGEDKIESIPLLLFGDYEIIIEKK